MTFVCCCSSPDCMANGCARTRQQAYAPNPPIKGNYTFTPFPLTEQDVRRIFREELERVRDGKAAPPPEATQTAPAK